MPEALDGGGVAGEIRHLVDAAVRAIRAGFEGVEIHGTGGYLPMQFLSSSTNRRTDAYGGTTQNRARFLLECIEGAAERVGPERVGVKLSPGFYFNDVHNVDTAELYAYLCGQVRWGLFSPTIAVTTPRRASTPSAWYTNITPEPSSPTAVSPEVPPRACLLFADTVMNNNRAEEYATEEGG
ncbi:oxidoreductase, partial [Rhodococcus sp. T7]|uniref:oxidoreductase n=1 Tax=Rhodococcus sp. T7 TaxID=627444 RepID=UPI003FA7653E